MSLPVDDQVDSLLEQLTDLLSQAEAHPQNVSILRQQIILMRQLQMMPEMSNVLAHLSSLVMLDQATWVTYLDQVLQSFTQPLTLDAFVTMLEKFDQAEKDYLSPIILQKHLEFILDCWRANTGDLESKPAVSIDPDVAEFLSEETVRGMLRATVMRGQGLLSETGSLWDLWLGWETSLLESSADKSSALQNLHSLYLSRLALPHSTMSSTSEAYSNFCSQHCPESYEQRMVEAIDASQAAKAKWSQERRYGKTREDLEQEISFAPDFATKAQAMISYTQWEADHRAQHHGRGRAPAADPLLTASIFERTISLYASTSAAVQATADEIGLQIKRVASRSRTTGKGKGKETKDAQDLAALSDHKRSLQESFRAYKDAEASLWSRYATWTKDENSGSDEIIKIIHRAVRACPQNGDVWSRFMFYQELRGNDPDALSEAFEQALAIGQLSVPDGRTNDLAEVYAAYAAYMGRAVDDAGATVMATVCRGMDAIHAVNKGGDSTLRLEKFLLGWVESKAPDLLEQALAAVDKPSKARASAYQMTLLRADIEIRRGDLTAARSFYARAIQRPDLDWPEVIYEAFLRFEDIHGTLDTISSAKKQIAREQAKVTKRREKLALEQAEIAQAYAEATGIQEAEITEIEQTKPEAGVQDAEAHFKRDREHTTLLVTGLAKGTDQVAIEAFFAECGAIREVTVLDDGTTALVEFRSVDSIPAALTRDRKRIDDQEVSVTMLWKSTLFITNFSRETDDVAIRSLFSQYGRILQTRWPSRKYADSRRFCYVTMDSPTAAQEALILHGYKIGEGFGLTVLISDPSAKAKRSDFSNSTLFVGGLTAKTTEVDVRGLLREYGKIQSLKLGWDPIKRICKGFAFVDMASEAEAQAALVLHGTQFQGRYLKVELSDPNHTNKKSHEKHPERTADRRQRSVKLLNLPADTQEGLLQQALEKLVPVKRVEIFAKDRQAVVELEAQADVGKLLLRTEPFLFGGNEIEVTEQTRRPPMAAATPTLVPRAARRAKVIGKPRATVAMTAATHDQGDFRAMVAEKNQERGKRKSDNEEPEAKRLKS